MSADASNQEVRFTTIAKALGIIAIVVGHSGSPIKPYVYLYHLALFFFISGYFFRDEYAQSPLLLIKKRIRTLYVPYIGYQLAFLCLHNVFMQVQIYSTQWEHVYTWHDFLMKGIKILQFVGYEWLAAPLWFLPSLFIVNILFCLIRFSSRSAAKRELITFVSVAGLYLFGSLSSYKDTDFALIVINAFVGLAVYYAGYMYRRFESKIPMHWFIALACVSLLVVSSRFGSIELSENEYGPPGFFLVNALMGIYANVYLSRVIAKSGKLPLLNVIGRSTLTIMALHVLSFKAIHLVQMYLNSYPLRALSSFPVIDGSRGWWIAYSAAGILIPLLIKSGFDRARGAIEKHSASCSAISP